MFAIDAKSALSRNICLASQVKLDELIHITRPQQKSARKSEKAAHDRGDSLWASAFVDDNMPSGLVRISTSAVAPSGASRTAWVESREDASIEPHALASLACSPTSTGIGRRAFSIAPGVDSKCTASEPIVWASEPRRLPE
eukprot:scaffold79524_cov24-Tisochrysis_lutea.AAC.2